MKNVLITGSNGYVGKKLISVLKNNKKFILIEIDKELPNNINLLDKDLGSFISKKINPQIETIIIHCAAARSDDDSYESYLLNNVEANINFLKAIDKINIVRFIHISSVAAIDGEKIFLNLDNVNEVETSDDAYRVTKYIQERDVINFCKTKKISWIVLQPSAIFSKNQPPNTNTYKLFMMMKRSPVVISSNALKSLTYLDNLIQTIHQNMETGITGKHLCFENPVLSISELSKLYCKAHKLRRIFVRPPIWLLNLIAAFSYLYSSAVNKKSVITRSRIEKYFLDTDYGIASKIYNMDVSLKNALKLID